MCNQSYNMYWQGAMLAPIRLPIAAAGQEASQLGDPMSRLSQSRRRERDGGALVDLGVEGLPFIGLQEDFTGGFRRLPRLIGHPEQSPGDDTIGRQGPLQPPGGLHLQLFDAAATFENQVIALNHPATSIPANTLGCLVKGLHRQASQQHPAQQVRWVGLLLPGVWVGPRLWDFLSQHRHEVDRLSNWVQRDRIVRTGTQRDAGPAHG